MMDGLECKELLLEAILEADLEKLSLAIAGAENMEYRLDGTEFDEKLPGWSDEYVGEGTCNSALHIACWLGRSRPLVDMLIDQLGCHLQQKSADDGYCPIHLAAFSGNIDIVTLLLDRGCSANEIDYNGFNPLHWASRGGKLDVIELLIDRGSDVHKKDKQGMMPLLRAAANGHRSAVELLIDRGGSDVSSVDHNGRTSLNWAAQEGHGDVIQLLLDRGVDICRKNKWGATALFNASFGGHSHIIKMFLSRGVSTEYINERDSDGNIALHFAIWQGKTDSIYLLLASGSNANVKDDEGRTCLQIASNQGHDAIVTVMKNWPATMLILVLQELVVYHLLDLMTYVGDLLDYIGQEGDYLDI